MTVLHITPLAHLDETLRSSQARWMASFSAPGSALERPAGLDGFLALEFNDIAQEQAGLQAVTQQQVDRLIAFLGQWGGEPALVLQCWMGVSRSTAAALIAAALAKPHMPPAALVAALRHAAPHATPNPLMVSHADEALGYGGAFLAAVKEAGRGAMISTAPAVAVDLDVLR